MLTKVDALFISKIEELNWLLNVRALGVHEYEPLVNAYALLIRSKGDRHQVNVFIDNENARKALVSILGSQSYVRVHSLSKFNEGIADRVGELS